MFEIQNRRYIGSKTKLLAQIDEVIRETGFDIKGKTFADLFAGTGVVAHYFAEKGCKVIVNDLLYSNYVVYKALISSERVDAEKIQRTLTELNLLDGAKLQDNYFSEIYSEKYFSANDCKKIGYIRDLIEERKKTYNEREYYIILTSLLYAVDKVANTVGHFEHFLKKAPLDSNFLLCMPNVEYFPYCKLFNMDSNLLAKEIKADVVYLDPPYNARQYVNFYHVLENLMRWNKPTEFEGSSMKFKRNNLKSGYSRAIATKLMKELIDSLDTKIIVVSYNNTYNAKSGASNNKIKEEELEDILKSKGEVLVKEIKYKFFNSGKTDLKNHLEKLYVCKVGK